MLDQEPFVYPTRARFFYDPGIPDRQLWAIGMIVVQWSMTETFIDMNTRHLIGTDTATLEEYNRQRNFQSKLAFWQTQLESRAIEPFRSLAIALIPRVQNLSTQRDEVVHRLWGGGLEGTSRGNQGFPTTDAGLMPKPGEKVASKKGGMIPFKWRADFPRLKRMAIEIATLNRDLMMFVMTRGTPHGHVDTDGQVTP